MDGGGGERSATVTVSSGPRRRGWVVPLVGLALLVALVTVGLRSGSDPEDDDASTTSPPTVSSTTTTTTTVPPVRPGFLAVEDVREWPASGDRFAGFRARGDGALAARAETGPGWSWEEGRWRGADPVPATDGRVRITPGVDVWWVPEEERVLVGTGVGDLGVALPPAPEVDEGSRIEREPVAAARPPGRVVIALASRRYGTDEGPVSVDARRVEILDLVVSEGRWTTLRAATTVSTVELVAVGNGVALVEPVAGQLRVTVVGPGSTVEPVVRSFPGGDRVAVGSRGDRLVIATRTEDDRPVLLRSDDAGVSFGPATVVAWERAAEHVALGDGLTVVASSRPAAPGIYDYAQDGLVVRLTRAGLRLVVDATPVHRHDRDALVAATPPPGVVVDAPGDEVLLSDPATGRLLHTIDRRRWELILGTGPNELDLSWSTDEGGTWATADIGPLVEAGPDGRIVDLAVVDDLIVVAVDDPAVPGRVSLVALRPGP